MNSFGHMDLRVADLAAAESFYDALLPALGFTERYHGGTCSGSGAARTSTASQPPLALWAPWN